MEKEIEIYCAECGVYSAGDYCQFCGDNLEPIEIIPLTPKKLQDYLDKYPNKQE